ncbi:MAG: FAD-dependent oxidoreductase [Clostridia bacterium]|nr:FAD-dependent oxidoreductase [Clostridia bacterium]
MFEKKTLPCELAVVGGGMAGVCCAVTAARRGVKVCLINDRPVLGGNASSEIRMWIRGSSDHFPPYRESGILEEIALKNAKLNPNMNYPMWDAVLFDLVKAEKNITLLLNAFVCGAEYFKNKIRSVRAVQLTTYVEYEISADYFADCSGDSVLAEFSPAKIETGREGQNVWSEALAPATSDRFTMGNSCLLQARETDAPVPYSPPPFARKIEDEEFKYRLNLNDRMGFIKNNYWWIELGGMRDALKDAEEIKDELLATVYGVWDYVKNSGKFDAENWELDFVGYYPAKRETRRYVGPYVLTQKDIDERTVFPDEIAYGGWTMDNHTPEGFYQGIKPNVFHPVTGPYSIPLRCLYSVNVKNLAFAGRNISASHLALSSTRVMATCALMGQAVGIMTATAKKYARDYTGIEALSDEIKQLLRNDDCYLLHTPRTISQTLLCSKNNLGEKEKNALFNGVERELDENTKAARFPIGHTLEFTFPKIRVEKLRLVFDSDLARTCQRDKNVQMYPQRAHIPKHYEKAIIPPRLTKGYTVEIKTDAGYRVLKEETENISRLVYLPVNEEISGIRFTGNATYGADEISLFSIDVA